MITEKFSKKERKEMQAALKRYGAIQDCADITGVHRSTITRVVKTGEASMPVAEKIRDYLNGFNSRLFMEAA
jgi:hypothetical protein